MSKIANYRDIMKEHEIGVERVTCITDARIDAASPPMADNSTSGSSPDAACNA